MCDEELDEMEDILMFIDEENEDKNTKVSENDNFI